MVMIVTLFSYSCDLMNLCSTKISLTNNSSSGKNYRLSIDGVNQGLVAAGETKEFDTAPGSHLVEIFDAATGNYACSPSSPTVVECQTYALSCTG